jgi:hypothetical protein
MTVRFMTGHGFEKQNSSYNQVLKDYTYFGDLSVND